MEAQDISQEQMAERLGVTQGAVGHWLNGKREPKLETINRLLGVLGVPGLAIIVPESSQTADRTDTAPPERLYRYPVVSWVTAGGWEEAVEPFEPGAADTYELTDYKAKGPAFWLKVRGDSMTSQVGQSIPEGMLILVDTGIEPSPGKLVIAKLPESNEATFKKLVEDSGQHFLKALNPAYPMIPLTEQCRLIGVVSFAKMTL
ncbi:helix-turn-helix domain-containing protein [Pseudomonas syringae]|nr:helix-turn-helix domain-containing protein [Pseudomonas syringae]